MFRPASISFELRRAFSSLLNRHNGGIAVSGYPWARKVSGSHHNPLAFSVVHPLACKRAPMGLEEELGSQSGRLRSDHTINTNVDILMQVDPAKDVPRPKDDGGHHRNHGCRAQPSRHCPFGTTLL